MHMEMLFTSVLEQRQKKNRTQQFNGIFLTDSNRSYIGLAIWNLFTLHNQKINLNTNGSDFLGSQKPLMGTSCSIKRRAFLLLRF